MVGLFSDKIINFLSGKDTFHLKNYLRCKST